MSFLGMCNKMLILTPNILEQTADRCKYCLNKLYKQQLADALFGDPCIYIGGSFPGYCLSTILRQWTNEKTFHELKSNINNIDCYTTNYLTTKLPDSIVYDNFTQLLIYPFNDFLQDVLRYYDTTFAKVGYHPFSNTMVVSDEFVRDLKRGVFNWDSKQPVVKTRITKVTRRSFEWFFSRHGEAPSQTPQKRYRESNYFWRPQPIAHTSMFYSLPCCVCQQLKGPALVDSEYQVYMCEDCFKRVEFTLSRHLSNQRKNKIVIYTGANRKGLYNHHYLLQTSHDLFDEVDVIWHNYFTDNVKISKLKYADIIVYSPDFERIENEMFTRGGELWPHFKKYVPRFEQFLVSLIQTRRITNTPGVFIFMCSTNFQDGWLHCIINTMKEMVLNMEELFARVGMQIVVFDPYGSKFKIPNRPLFSKDCTKLMVKSMYFCATTRATTTNAFRKKQPLPLTFENVFRLAKSDDFVSVAEELVSNFPKMETIQFFENALLKNPNFLMITNYEGIGDRWRKE